ncbi:hypothetical protein VTK73DRAFT_8160 [Phialemonium thermophilum]|uniref:Beta-lactamase-related domain-containing protein n=1 Tax=Phialemonium thermophilum TaxID=223376 RepID=A0ABR3WA25_9PEZI
MQAGNAQYSKCLGYSSLEPGNQRPMRPGSVFKIASASKLIATIAVLQAVERGLIGLDDDVEAYIPELTSQAVLTGFTWYGKPIVQPRRKTITVAHLLTQTAGTGYDFLNIHPLWRYRWWHRQAIAGGDTVEERYAYPLLHEPGDGWTYGSGLSWAGRIVERVSGRSLEDWVREHIREPLGLSSVTFFPHDNPDVAARLVSTSYRSSWTGKVQYCPELDRPESSTECLGGEGVYASMEDMLAILRSLLVDDEKLLGKKTTAMMFRPQLTEVQRCMMRKCLELPRWICETILKKDEYDWGTGGVLIDGDGHECLQKGTLMWSGLFHNLWVRDRTFLFFSGSLLGSLPWRMPIY